MEEIKLNDKIIELPLADIKPYEGSHKTDASVDYLVQSIQDYGIQQPIVIDKDNVVVAGNGLYKAAVKLGLETVPCIKTDYLTEEQVNQYRIADNKTSEFAKWNDKKLRKELSYLSNPEDLQPLFDENISQMLGLNVQPVALKVAVSKTESRPAAKEEVLKKVEQKDKQFKESMKAMDLKMAAKPTEYYEYHCSKCGKLVKVRKN